MRGLLEAFDDLMSDAVHRPSAHRQEEVTRGKLRQYGVRHRVHVGVIVYVATRPPGCEHNRFARYTLDGSLTSREHVGDPDRVGFGKRLPEPLTKITCGA